MLFLASSEVKSLQIRLAFEAVGLGWQGKIAAAGLPLYLGEINPGQQAELEKVGRLIQLTEREYAQRLLRGY